VSNTYSPPLVLNKINLKNEDLKSILNYELAPYPLALFNEFGMRKTSKSALYKIFPLHENNQDIKNTQNVIDGGFILHRVKWVSGSTISDLCKLYITYIKKHYGPNCCVVFDGYEHTSNSTKVVEQNRRRAHTTSVDIEFNYNTTVTVQQEHFLANSNNKSRFINLLSHKMNIEGIETTTAVADADTTIVRCAIDKATSNSKTTVIIGEDIDLVILLIALAPQGANMFFVKPARGNLEMKTYSTSDLQQLGMSQSILVIHAFSGCDTTSSVYRKGKHQIVKLFQKNQRLAAFANVFYDPSSTPEAVSTAGEKIMLAMYRSCDEEINQCRYNAFLKSAHKIHPDLASLPPTKDAAKQHSFRVYYQVQIWLGNNLHPEEWGWKRSLDGSLEPVMTMDPAAPDSILKAIFCRCSGSCGARCGCRKAGINCTSVCGNCEGRCTNKPPLDAIDEYDSEDDRECD